MKVLRSRSVRTRYWIRCKRGLRGITLGADAAKAVGVRAVLEDQAIFGVDLYAAGLGGTIEGMFTEMLAGPGAVRATLEKYTA